jgi:CheY-like chemotaxis protein
MGSGGMKIVVCDDDATLRSVVSRMAEEVGHTVIAETDSAHDAVELITRFGADALVLDLSLPWGSGMEAIYEIRQRELACKIIVFTSYAEDSPEVRRSGVQAVVEKPDFEMLDEVLKNLGSGVATPGAGAQERRKRPRPRPRVPAPDIKTPSGIEEPESFAGVVDVLEPGDGVLYVHVTLPHVDEPNDWTELVQADRFLAVGRNLRTVLRIQDRLTVEEGQFKCLLLDGERAGVESVWRRLQRVEELTGGGTVVNGGWSLCQEAESPYATVVRAKNACERSVGKPPGDRLWAG